MCTAAEPAIHPHDSRAGTPTQGATTSAQSAAPSAMPVTSRSLSTLDLTSAFHTACRSAAPSTASVTGAEISMPPLENHLVDERRHALHRGPAFGDRFLRAVVVHGGEVRQQRRDQHVGGLAGEAAARDALLDDV